MSHPPVETTERYYRGAVARDAARELAKALLTWDGKYNRPVDDSWELLEVDREAWEAWVAAARRVLDEGAP